MSTLKPIITRYSNVVCFEGEGARELASYHPCGARQTLTGVSYPKSDYLQVVASLNRAGFHVETPKGI